MARTNILIFLETLIIVIFLSLLNISTVESQIEEDRIKVDDEKKVKAIKDHISFVMLNILLPAGIGLGSSYFASRLFKESQKRTLPKLKICPSIARTNETILNGEDKKIFLLKVINKTESDLINTKAELYLAEELNIGNGKVRKIRQIQLEKQPLIIPKFSTDNHLADYAFWFTTTEDIDKTWHDINHQYLIFRIYTEHSFSGAGKVFINEFRQKNKIIEGKFVFGESCNINGCN